MTDIRPESERLAILETKVAQLTEAVKDMNHALTTHFERARIEQQEAARFDRKEQADLIEKQQKVFIDMLAAERKATEERYKDYPWMKSTLLKLMGALILLSLLFKDSLERLVRALLGL